MALSSFLTPIPAVLGLGPTEVVIIGIVALLLFGRRLPEVARSMGKSIVQFKKGLRDVEEDIDEAAEDAPPPEPTGDEAEKSR